MKKEISFISTKNIIIEELYKDFLKSYAYVILAAVENVESVACNYECNGIQKSYRLSNDEASKFVGKNIKNIFQKYSDIQWLLEKICCFSAKRKREIDSKEQKDVATRSYRFTDYASITLFEIRFENVIEDEVIETNIWVKVGNQTKGKSLAMIREYVL